MKNNSYSRCLATLGFVASAAFVGACSSSGGGGASNISLGSLPSASGLVAANIGSSQSDSSLTRALVSGTPPTIGDLEFTDFYGDLLTRMQGGTNNDKACEDERNEFFGQYSDGVGGDTACWMSQSVGGAVSNLMGNAGSLCYMKNIPNAESGVTISPSGTEPDAIFAKESNDKVVRVNVVDPENGSEAVFIKVYGSSNEDVGSDRYKVSLWFCGDDGVSGAETFMVDTANLTFTSSGVNDDEHGQNSFEISASIEVANDGTVTYDPTKTRTASVQFIGAGSEAGRNSKSLIEIDGDNILTAKEYNSDAIWGSSKNYVKAEIAGSGVSTLQFLQGAIRSANTPADDEIDPHSFAGAVEWQDTLYRSVASSDLKDAIPVSYQSEDFYSTGASVDPDFSEFSCDTTASVTIEMDFASEGVAAIQEICEAERFEWSNICYSGDVNTLRTIIDASWNAPDNTCGS
jgi:hypothetical protein